MSFISDITSTLSFSGSSLALWLDLLGTFVFALSGALLAIRRDYDIVGIVVLSVAAGLGGGMTRDLILGDTPPVAFRNEIYLLTALAAAGVVFLFHERIEQLNGSVRLFDAFGLGIFAVSGAMKSLDFDIGPIPAVLLGVVTGAGGGVVRDLLALEAPMILRREVYALAALAGAGIVVLASILGVSVTIGAVAGVAATFALRVMAIRYGWQAPRPRSSLSAND